MNNLKHKYNPEYYYLKAQELLETVSQEDAAAWYQHPCTQSLLNSIEGDLSGIVLMWLGGAYSSEESSDLTVQRSAKARGMAQAGNDIINTISSIRKLTLREESVSSGN